MIPNVSPTDAWQALHDNPSARLVDVRTDAEWAYVGLPDLDAVGQSPVLISWQIFPTGAENGRFLEQLRAAGITPQHHVYFLCRSGVRSQAAALTARAAGYGHVHNIADGFEGAPDAHGHRGMVGGWKFCGLPWRQR